jgi:NADPH:quinone reductase-like Zn-dependent oxidoreductase
MRAIEQRAYGDPGEVLQLTEVDVPEIAADGVLVRVRASSANPYDWHLICGEPVLMRPALGWDPGTEAGRGWRLRRDRRSRRQQCPRRGGR